MLPDKDPLQHRKFAFSCFSKVHKGVKMRLEPVLCSRIAVSIGFPSTLQICKASN
jgi:hypothetical protein